MRSPVRPSPWMRLSRIELQHVRAGRNASQQQRGAGYQVREMRFAFCKAGGELVSSIQ